jgi:chromosome segregation ATPase
LIAQEVALLEQQIVEVLEKSDAGGQSLEALENENKLREGRAQEHQQRIDEIVARRVEVQEQQTQVKVALGQLTEKRTAAAETINALRRGVRDLEGSTETARVDIEQCRARRTEAEAAIRTATDDLSRLEREIGNLESRCRELRDQREALRSELDGLAHAARAARQQLAEVESQRHQQEMTLAEARVRRDELSNRVMEEMAINLGERYGQYQHAEQDWTEVENEIGELRRGCDQRARGAGAARAVSNEPAE